VAIERTPASEALRASAVVLLWSRVVILAVAALSALWAGGGGAFVTNAEAFDVPALTHPFGGLGDALLSPLARWDAVWYLQIADSGYGEAGSARTAFFPLYPPRLALVCEERRITDRVVAVSAVGLGLFVTQFAAWNFVA